MSSEPDEYEGEITVETSGVLCPIKKSVDPICETLGSYLELTCSFLMLFHAGKISG